MSTRVAVITGAAGLIGQGLVKGFREAGYEVIATDQGEGDWVPCDLSKPEEIEAFVGNIPGNVDALINNAGIPNWDRSVKETTVEQWDHLLAINLRAPWLLTKLLVPKFSPGASVVNIASIRAAMSDNNNEPYSASKGGLLGLTQAMALSLGRSNRIRINVISPGMIVSEEEQTRDEDNEIHPLGRVGHPADIANMALFLCSPASEFITGAEYLVDGGMSRVLAYPD